jgi:hypothetical protein
VLRDQTRNLDLSSGQLGFAELVAATAENAGTIEVRVRRTLGRLGAVSVQYATAGATAAEGSDYTAATGTLTWSAGDLADKVIAVPIADDAALESAETFTVTLSALTGGAVLDGSSSLTVTIDDNDARPPPSGGGGGGGGATDLALLALLAGVLLARGAVRLRSRPR